MNESNRRAPVVFVSYRREDEKEASYLRLSLVLRYGEENVFMDKSSIPAGAGFPEEIEWWLRRSDILVALIGRNWVSEIRENAINEVDFVRAEIHSFLEQKKLIVPVLISGAEKPEKEKIHYQVRGMLNHEIKELHNAFDSSEVDTLLDSAHRAFEQRNRTRQEVDRMDEIPPSAGLALGYFVNFIRETVLRIAELTPDGGTYKHMIEVRERSSDSVVHAFGDRSGSRGLLKLYIVIPPSLDCLLPQRLDPVLQRLQRASIRATGAQRPFLLNAHQIDGNFHLIDFPSTLGVLNTWLQRHFASLGPRRDSAEWKRTEAEEMRRFESILGWWIDDPVNGLEFRDRVRLLRFTGKEKDLAWLSEYWGAG